MTHEVNHWVVVYFFFFLLFLLLLKEMVSKLLLNAACIFSFGVELQALRLTDHCLCIMSWEGFFLTFIGGGVIIEVVTVIGVGLMIFVGLFCLSFVLFFFFAPVDTK